MNEFVYCLFNFRNISGRFTARHFCLYVMKIILAIKFIVPTQNQS